MRYLLRFSHYLILLAVLLVLGGCTREREPWPTPSPTFVPESAATLLPALTPHVTPEPVEPAAASAATATPAPSQASGPLPVPGSGDDPMLAATATPLPGSAGAGEIFTYPVAAGDTLYSIARQFGVEVATLIQINSLSDPNALRVGQILTIPGEAPAGLVTGEGYTHVVAAGETLFSIAQHYGVPLDQLAQANGITNPNNIRVGQRLSIPQVGADVAAPGVARRVHVIQPGETLTSIAAQYGVSPQAIVDANHLIDPNRLVSGKQLIIP